MFHTVLMLFITMILLNKNFEVMCIEIDKNIFFSIIFITTRH